MPPVVHRLARSLVAIVKDAKTWQPGMKMLANVETPPVMHDTAPHRWLICVGVTKQASQFEMAVSEINESDCH